MSPQSWKERLYVMPVLMHDIYPDVTAFVPTFMSLRLSTRINTWAAVAWPSLHLPSDSSRIAVCEATVLDIRVHPDFEPLALVDWRPGDRQLVFDLIPDARCPIYGVVSQTCELIQSIESPGLRSLLAETFLQSDIYERYWTAPASLSHHHSYPGGLAQHSLEVAVATSSIRGIDPWQRDVMLAYALLHDIGKVWAYVDGQLTPEARLYGHEALGLRAVQPVLEASPELDEQSRSTLRKLLLGEWKRTWRAPEAPLGEIVRAMDRFSAARSVGNASCSAEYAAPNLRA